MSTQDFNEEIFVIDNYCEFFNESFFKTTDSHRHNEITEIIGKPLTLSRVLLALKSKEDLSNPKKYELYLGITKLFYYNYAKNIELVLDLKKETLEEQSEETQRKINELFNN